MASIPRRSNGTGSIYKSKERRRNPWRVMVSDSWEYDELNETSKLKRITLGYFKTKDEATKALMEYNDHPYHMDSKTLTFSTVYEKWSDEYFPTLASDSSIRTIKAAFNHCSPIHNMIMRDLRVSHLEGVIRNASTGDSTKARIKSLFNLMYRFAMRHEIVTKDYAQLCNPVKKPVSKDKIPFSSDEISLLWDNLYKIPFVDTVLIGIYTGFRPQELATLKTSNIDLDSNIIKAGMKTDAGRDRIVPIHQKILPLIQERYNPNNTFLFNDDTCTQGIGRQLSYDKYRGRFKKIMDMLNLKHTPHETRHTFITLGKRYKMDDFILKLIVGHSIRDVTKNIYTHRTSDELHDEINKIKI